MIGIVDARRQLGSILAAAPVARVVDATGVEHVEYRDPSGSTLFGHIAGGELVCLTPFFRAPTPSMWRVDTSSVCVDADCVHCSGIDVDIYAGDDTEGAFTTRTTLQLVRGAAFAADRMRTIVDRAVVAFARRVDTFADADAFHADSKTAAVLAVPSFLPTGLFGPAGDVGARAMCTFVGTVRATEMRVHSITGAPFVHIVVDGLTGPIDVVADAREVPPPSPGKVVRIVAGLFATD
jgi:hypothetical protein